ncbi:MAG: glycosyltransferase family 4 protein [Candidatus Devosia phytovorans]|uniref:Glycosyltransferase family 4 protein n=1 Tax=Candidatus Devosia phytovorans TaxID=3121372 RepID=A0AAJ5VT24_9HYPH|nr:glycosyltransferase family 4 protein [Devosia sp.]WEK03640.1 MAG: glycosyltransferase family 4 protein [Devosia sp.]
MRVLVLAHNHPALHPGGTEIFAHDLFHAYKRQGAEALFVAATNDLHRKQRPGTSFQTIGPSGDEVVLWAGHFDRFYMSQTDSYGTMQDMARLLADYRPDVVHLHHLLLAGAELPFVARRVLPKAEIVLTLHDYYPICHRDGLMLRNRTNEHCTTASPSACNACFPDIGADRFLLRERNLKTLLKAVDRFIAPSQFLRDRYVEWGLPPDRITVLHNARPAVAEAPTLLNRVRTTFGYFGNLNPFKGVDGLLEAAKILRDSGLDFELRVHGGAPYQSPAFTEKLDRLSEDLGGNLVRIGPYGRDRIPALMAAVHWAIVPSIWWENAPLVIQEAFQHRRPVITSGIGGMAEMVHHEVTGLHAQPNDPIDLARVMRRAIEEPGLHTRLAAAIPKQRTIDDCAAEHLALFAANRPMLYEVA